MTNNADAFRRWLGMFFLAASFAMMMWGQIVLHPYLAGVAFALYWSVCFGLSIAAVVIGILDVRAMLRNRPPAPRAPQRGRAAGRDQCGPAAAHRSASIAAATAAG